MLSGFGYGAVSNYIGLYCEQTEGAGRAGLFFFILALGIVLARLLSAKSLNRGKITEIIYIGTALIIIAFGLFPFVSGTVSFYLIAVVFGAGYGYLTPAFQTMIINLGRHDQRGTANATYFIFWDLGIGLGIALGGVLIQNRGFNQLFMLCTALTIAGLLFFIFVSAAYFRKNKLR